MNTPAFKSFSCSLPKFFSHPCEYRLIFVKKPVCLMGTFSFLYGSAISGNTGNRRFVEELPDVPKLQSLKLNQRMLVLECS